MRLPFAPPLAPMVSRATDPFIGINKLVDYKDRDDNAALAKSSI